MALSKPKTCGACKHFCDYGPRSLCLILEEPIPIMHPLVDETGHQPLGWSPLVEGRDRDRSDRPPGHCPLQWPEEEWEAQLEACIAELRRHIEDQDLCYALNGLWCEGFEPIRAAAAAADLSDAARVAFRRLEHKILYGPRSKYVDPTVVSLW